MPHDKAAFELAASLAPRKGMKLINALHYATALLNGCHFILTNDSGFKADSAIEIIRISEIIN